MASLFRPRGAYIPLFAVLVFWGALSSGCPALAAQRDVKVSVSSKVAYDDNIFYDEDARRDDFVTTISPGVSLDYLTERTQVRAAARLDWIRYHQLDEFNDLDQDLSLSIRQSLDPRTSIEVNADWKIDSQTDRDFDETGLIYGTEKRQIWSLSTGLTRSHTEVASSRVSFSLQGEDYETGNHDEVTAYGASYGFFRGLNERTTLRAFLNYSLQDYAAARIDKVSATLGAEWNFNERLRFSCDLGGRWTRSQQDRTVFFFDGFNIYQFTEQVEDDEWGGVAKLSVTQRYHSGQASMTFSHDLETASGNSSSTERTGFGFSASRRFSRSWIGRFASSYYMNQSVGDSRGTNKIDATSLSLSPSIRYQFSPELAFDLGYRYSLNDDKAAGRRTHKNLWFLQLTWSDSFMDL